MANKGNNILQIIGARPNLVKFINVTGRDKIIWTGQHYDEDMKCFKIPEPDYDLGLIRLGKMIDRIVEVIEHERPDLVLVYGDTRSALAGALAADQKDIPLAHVEAGCRCGDLKRPEERIRKMIDHISDYLFCVTESNLNNLDDERVCGQAFIVGDLHYDRYVQNRAHGDFVLVTIHRAEHTNDEVALRKIIRELKCKEKVIFPMHPRTKEKIKEFGIKLPANVQVVTPLKYLDFQKMLKLAKYIITDSGGVSREAWFSGTPVKIIGKSEWPEIQSFGTGNTEERIREILLKEIKHGR